MPPKQQKGTGAKAGENQPKQRRRGNSRRQARRKAQAPQERKARQEVRLKVAPMIKDSAGRRNIGMLKAFVLPSEASAKRLTVGANVSTVVTQLTGVRAMLPAPHPTSTITAKSIFRLGGMAIMPGLTILHSRQPSRVIGYTNVGGTTRYEYGMYTTGTLAGSTNAGTPVAKMYCTHPDLTGMSNMNPMMGLSTEIKLIPDLDITPRGLSTTDTSNLPTSHVALSTGGQYYIWLDPGDTVSINLYLAATMSPSAGLSIATTFTFAAYTGVEGSDPNMSLVQTGTFTISAATSIAFSGSPIAIVSTLSSGYYRITAQTNLAATTTCTMVATINGAAPGLCYSVKVLRAAGGMMWEAAPEFYTYPMLYQNTRTVACSALLSNRSAVLNKGGTVVARCLADEASLSDLATGAPAISDFYAQCAQRANRMSYDGDLAAGLYTWLRPGEDDMLFRNYVSPTGSGLYLLDVDLPVSIINAMGATIDNSMWLHWDIMIESTVATVQSFGTPLEPRLSRSEFDELLKITRGWEIFHENPSHVMDYLKKIFGAGWNAFKFAAPHIVQAATAVASGATPLGALVSVLSHAL